MKLLFLIFVVACSGKLHEAKSSSDPRTLQLEGRVKAKKSAPLLDSETGWPSVVDCDATLWAGLARMSSLEVVRLELAVAYNGRVQRRPGEPCWNEQDGDVGSKSECSNDMILGYMGGMWRAGNLAALQKLADYGEKNKWVMCEPFPEMASRVVLKTNQIGLLGRMIYALSNGRDDRVYRRLFAKYVAVVEDYEKHIQALGILLQGEVDEYLRLNSLDATRADPETGGGSVSHGYQ